jgi:hypothetical protein
MLGLGTWSGFYEGVECKVDHRGFVRIMRAWGLGMVSGREWDGGVRGWALEVR